jgi:hypothetical protein
LRWISVDHGFCRENAPSDMSFLDTQGWRGGDLGFLEEFSHKNRILWDRIMAIETPVP